MTVFRIVTAEVGHENSYLSHELDIKGFHDIETTVPRLHGNYLVNIGVVVHAYADRRVRVNVIVGTGIKSTDFATTYYKRIVKVVVSYVGTHHV